jgi:hypothetical protein
MQKSERASIRGRILVRTQRPRPTSSTPPTAQPMGTHQLTGLNDLESMTRRSPLRTWPRTFRVCSRAATRAAESPTHNETVSFPNRCSAPARSSTETMPLATRVCSQGQQTADDCAGGTNSTPFKVITIAALTSPPVDRQFRVHRLPHQPSGKACRSSGRWGTWRRVTRQKISGVWRSASSRFGIEREWGCSAVELDGWR